MLKFTNLTFLRTLSLLALFLIIASCNKSSDDDNQPAKSSDKAIGEEKAIKAMKAVLRDRGLAQGLLVLTTEKSGDGPTLEDYMSTEVNNAGYREINLNLDDKGNIIHSDGWQQTVPNYCKDKAGGFREPTKRITIRIYPATDNTLGAEATYKDLESANAIEDKTIGEGKSLEVAIDKALEQLDEPIGQVVDPCDEEANYKVKLTTATKQDVTKDDGVTIIKDEASFSIDLSYNEQKGFYEGRGELKWDLYEYLPPNPLSADCQKPENSFVNVLMKAKKGVSSPDSLQISIEFYDKGGNIAQKQASCTISTPNGSTEGVGPSSLPTVWLERHKSELDTIVYPKNPDRDIGYFTMRSFKAASSKPDILAQKTYEGSFTRSNGDAKFTEDTKIQVYRE